MRIDCDSCGAAYAIDDSLISDRGIRAQCPKCGTQKVVKKPAAADPFAAPPSSAGANPFGGGGTGAGGDPFGAPAAPSTPDPFGARPGPAPGGPPAAGPADPFGAPSAPSGDNPFAPPGAPPAASAPPSNPFGGAPSGGDNPFAPPAASGGQDPFAAAPAGSDPFGGNSGGGGGGGDPFGGAPAPAADPFNNANPFAALGAGGDEPKAPAPEESNPFGAPAAKKDDPFGGSNPFAGVKDAKDAEPSNPFADVGGALPNEDPFAGVEQDGDTGGAATWQVKAGRKVEKGLTVADVRERIRAGQLKPNDLAGPEGQDLKPISDISLLNVTLPRVARARGATGASAAGGSFGRILGALVVVGLLGAGAFGVYTFFPGVLESASEDGVNPFRKSTSAWDVNFPEVVGTSQEHVVDGRKFMKADTAQSYRQADEEFRKALILDVGNLQAIAGYVENFANLPNAKADDVGMQLAFEGIEWARKKAPDDPTLMRAQGALYLAKNEIEPASKVLRKAARADPGTVETKLLLAQTELDRAPAEALKLVRRVREKAPELKLALLVEGAALRRLGEFDVARQRFEERLVDDPGNTATLKELARLKLDLGDGKGAVAHLEKLLSVEERDIEARLMRAKILYQLLGRVSDAAAELKFIRENYREPAGDLILPTLSHAAYLAFLSGDIEGAEAIAIDARKTSPGYAPGAYVHGLILDAKKDEQMALSAFADAVRIISASGPGSENENVARIALADAEFARGNVEDALRNYNLVIEYFPRYAPGFFAFAAAHMSAERPGQAATYMRKALDIDPHHEDDRLTLTDFPAPPSRLMKYAKIYRAAKVKEEGRPLKFAGEGMIRFVAGQRGASKSLFLKAKKEDRLNHAALLYLGVLALDAGRVSEADKHLSLALRTTAKNHAVTRMYAARVLHKKGKTDEALKKINAILETETTFAAASFTRARLLLAKGEQEEANQALKEIVKEFADFIPAKTLLNRLDDK